MALITVTLTVAALGGVAAIPAGAATRAAGAPTPQAAATAAVAKLAGGVKVPDGLTPAGGDQSSGLALTKLGAGAPDTTQIVVKTRWFTSTIGAVNVYQEAAAAMPPGGTQVGGQFGTGADQLIHAYRPGAGLSAEGVQIAAAATASGGTAVRIDAWAIYRQPRPAAEQVPSGVRAVSITAITPAAATKGGGVIDDLPKGGPWPIATVTQAAQVKALTGWLNGLKTSPGFPPSCPPGYAQPGYELRYLGPGHRVLATAAETGCGLLDVTIGSRSEPALSEVPDTLGEGLEPLTIDELVDLLWAQHALPVCQGSQLTPGPAEAEANPGDSRVFALLSYTNHSSQGCGEAGAPAVTLLGPGGTVLPTHATRAGTGTPHVLVVLPKAQGMTQLNWSTAATSCSGPAVSAVRVTLPGASSPLTFPVTTGQSSFDVPFTPCGGTLTVGDIS